MLSRWAGAGLAALALAACASLQEAGRGPEPETPPARWTGVGAAGAPGEATQLAGWWARFGDPALPPLIEQALTTQTDVLTAQARLRQARAQRTLAAAGLAPALGAGTSARASLSEGRGSTESFGASLDASWELDLWGGGAAGVRAADATLRASELTLAHTRVLIAAEVATTLLELRGTQAREAIARRVLASQEQTLQIVQWRLDAGLATSLDLAQARTGVEQTRASLPTLAAGAMQSMNALAVLTGRAPGSLQAHLSAPAALPAVPSDLALSIPAEVLRQRPDVQAAERRWAAAAERVNEADAARLPGLSLGGSIGLSALSLGALGPGAGVASLLASVSVPVLDGGRARSLVRTQEASRDEAGAAWRATVLAALQEVEDALVALRSARERVVAEQAAVASARTAATLADQRYRSGLVDFQSVLQTQRTLLSSEDSLAGTTTALATAHVRLIKALGGGWSPGRESGAAVGTEP